MDSYAGYDRDPRTFHKYSYTRNNPTNHRDPDGMDDDGSITADASISIFSQFHFVSTVNLDATMANLGMSITNPPANGASPASASFDVHFLLTLTSPADRSAVEIFQLAQGTKKPAAGNAVINGWHADVPWDVYADPFWWDGQSWNYALVSGSSPYSRSYGEWTSGGSTDTADWHDYPGIDPLSSSHTTYDGNFMTLILSASGQFVVGKKWGLHAAIDPTGQDEPEYSSWQADATSTDALSTGFFVKP